MKRSQKRKREQEEQAANDSQNIVVEPNIETVMEGMADPCNLLADHAIEEGENARSRREYLANPPRQRCSWPSNT